MFACLPTGTWIESDTGSMQQGPLTYTRTADLSEIPVYIQVGAVIPSQPIKIGQLSGIASKPISTLVFSIYPGQTSGSTSVYEDDGVSLNYLDGTFATTAVSYQRSGQSSLTITINTTGDLSVLPANRQFAVRLVNSMPILSATCTIGSTVYPITYQRFSDYAPWSYTYDGPAVTAMLSTALVPIGSTISISVQIAPWSNADAVLSGLKGAMNHAVLAKRNLDQTWETPGANSVNGEFLMELASTGEVLTYFAGTDINAFTTTVSNFRSSFAAALSEIQKLQPSAGTALLSGDDSIRPFSISGSGVAVSRPQLTVQRLAYSLELLQSMQGLL